MNSTNQSNYISNALYAGQVGVTTTVGAGTGFLAAFSVTDLNRFDRVDHTWMKFINSKTIDKLFISSNLRYNLQMAPTYTLLFTGTTIGGYLGAKLGLAYGIRS